MPSETPAAESFPQDRMEEYTQNLARIAAKSSLLIEDYINKKVANDDVGEGEATMLSAMRAFSTMLGSIASNPQKFWQAQYDLYQEYIILWSNTAARMMGEKIEPFNITPEKDRRFKDNAWSELMVFDYIKQSYMVLSDWVTNTVNNVDGIDSKTKLKLNFFTRQWLEAISPSNFVMTNPQVLRETLETGGENLLRGLENLLSDMQRSKGKLQVSMTDPTAFEVGGNLALTEGAVIFQNDLMQLIQYSPSTVTAHKTPLLIVSPWINKYYILDLQPQNSMVKWLVDQGHTVFITSWVNPNQQLAHKKMEDYMLEGPVAALDAIEKATGETSVNAVGYCLGGTLMSATLCYLKAKKMADKIRSVTFFTTLTDFTNPGELSVFIDELQLEKLEERVKKDGVFDGADMGFIFRSLRANDLIWSFVVNNYLLGKSPFPFDLLYWNSDCTAMPAAMHIEYLRTMYEKNLLVKPNALSFGGVPIDLSNVETPAYVLATREDHIAPWASCYAMTQLFKGPMRFVLSASGHVAGVVNPPAKSKYGFWTHGSAASKPSLFTYPTDPQNWLEAATEYKTSWWLDWHEWLTTHFADGTVDADTRKPGNRKLSVLEKAPGSYVKVRY